MPLRYIERDISRLPQYQPLPPEHLAGLAQTIEQQHQAGVQALYGRGAGAAGTRGAREGTAGTRDFQTLEENILAGTAGLPDAYRQHVSRELGETYEDLERIADEQGYRTLGPLVQRRGRELSHRLHPFMEDAQRLRAFQERLGEVEGPMPAPVRQYLQQQAIGMPEDGQIFDPETGEYRSPVRDVALPPVWRDAHDEIDSFVRGIEADVDSDRFLTESGVISGYRRVKGEDGRERMVPQYTEHGQDAYVQRRVTRGRSEDRIVAAVTSRILTDLDLRDQLRLELEARGVDPDEVVGQMEAPDGEIHEVTAEQARIYEIADTYAQQRGFQDIRYENLRESPDAIAARASDAATQTRTALPRLIARPDSPFNSLENIFQIEEDAETQMGDLQRLAAQDARRMGFAGVHFDEETGEAYMVDQDGSLVERAKDSEGNYIPSTAEAGWSMQYQQSQQQRKLAQQYRDEAVKRVTGGEHTTWESFIEAHDEIDPATLRRATQTNLNELIAREIPSRSPYAETRVDMEQWMRENPERAAELRAEAQRRALEHMPRVQEVNEALQEMGQQGELEVSPLVFEDKRTVDRLERLYLTDIAHQPVVAVYDKRTGKEITDEPLPQEAFYTGHFRNDDDGKVYLLYREKMPSDAPEDAERRDMMVVAPSGIEDLMIAGGHITEAKVAINSYIMDAANHPGLEVPIKSGDSELSLRLNSQRDPQPGMYTVIIPADISPQNRVTPVTFSTSEGAAQFIYNIQQQNR